MKIAFITDWTPTQDNYNGPSAHLYHLLKARGEGVELLVYSTNKNKVDEEQRKTIEYELDCKMHFVSKSFLSKLKTSRRINNFSRKIRRHPIGCDSYYELPSKIIKKIRDYSPDIVWLYPHSLIKVANQLKEYRILVTGADCAALHSSRLIRDEYVFENKIIDSTLEDFKERLNLEVAWQTIDNAHIHLVGITDQIYFNTISPRTKARFFQHPHYNLTDKEISLDKPMFKVLISGKFDLYTYSDSKKLFTLFVDSQNTIIKEKYEFVFLGKGWEPFVNQLVVAGYNARKQEWVEDYVEFIKDFDIQIFPISVGSGTKGKVLDALSTGLLCIGSQIAFENIAVKANESCLVYTNVCEVLDYLILISQNSKDYELVAKSGRENIRNFHNAKDITEKLIEWCINDNYRLDCTPFFQLTLK